MSRQTQTETIYIGVTQATPLGAIWVAITPAGLVALEIGGDQEQFISRLRRARPDGAVIFSPQMTSEATRQVEEYLQGRRRQFDLAIDWRGMRPFQRQVLRATQNIPYGQVSTYAAIAQAVGRPGAARAVGRAEATNPMPLVIPCHRVIGADGGLRGYGAPGGLQTKAWLLRLEAETTHTI